MELKYRHCGYFDDLTDISYLYELSSDEILDYYLLGCGLFNIVDEIVEDVNKDSGEYTNSGQFIIVKSSNSEDDSERIDIYEVIEPMD